MIMADPPTGPLGHLCCAKEGWMGQGRKVSFGLVSPSQWGMQE